MPRNVLIYISRLKIVRNAFYVKVQTVVFYRIIFTEVPAGTTPILAENGKTFSDWMKADDNIQRISDAVRDEVSIAINSPVWNKYEAVEYQFDYIGGTHYRIRLDVGDELFLELDVFESYPVPDSQVSFLGAEWGKMIIFHTSTFSILSHIDMLGKYTHAEIINLDFESVLVHIIDLSMVKYSATMILSIGIDGSEPVLSLGLEI